MTVLVVGGTGFVGGHVVHALRTEDLPVRVLARKPESQERLRAWGCEVVAGDMTDAASLSRAVAGAKTFVHLVALPPFAASDAVSRVMEQGTRDLLRAAQEADVERVVLMSGLGIDERSENLVAYNRAKLVEEHEVERSGLEHTIFKPSFIFGPDGGMLPALIRLVRWSPVTPVVGTRRFQPIWVEDVAAYFAKAVAAEPAVAGTYELAGPDVVTFGELHERLRRVLGKRRLAFQMPTGLVRTGAAAASALRHFRSARGAVDMLEFDDNVADIRPAVEAFGVEPITLDEQLRRATAARA
ncbi:MAG TPA: NAD(P)H-binding protein [Gaiellaceae bacterium]|nr:NAD(P)H-binding protein [Gaiellaceae bacterium]